MPHFTFSGPALATSFYLLNMGACWKNDGTACDGNTSTDVTRYLLMETNPGYDGGCKPETPLLCPRLHRFLNGTVVDRNSTSFPYGAYKYWCAPPSCGDRLPGEPTCDPDSNPMQQTIVKLAPHAEWAAHGFPAEPGAGWGPSGTSLAASRGFPGLRFARVGSPSEFACVLVSVTSRIQERHFGLFSHALSPVVSCVPL